MSKRYGKKTSSINKTLAAGAGVIIIVALLLAASSNNSGQSSSYYTLASWNYDINRLSNETVVPLTVDLTLLPNWPDVSIDTNSSSFRYLIEPAEPLEFTLVYNLTVRQQVPMLLQSNVVQKRIIGDEVTYIYLAANSTFGGGLLVNDSYIFERKFIISLYQLQYNINWEVLPLEFIVGWINSADPTAKFDFSLEVGYAVGG